MIILKKSNFSQSEFLSSYIKEAYKYSSEEEYLLSFLDKHADCFNEEAEDDILSLVQENAVDHDGHKMSWYSKAKIDDDVVLDIGDQVLIKSSEKHNPINAQVISITDKGVYLKDLESNNIYFGYVLNGKLVYDGIKNSSLNKEAFYIIPQYEDRDLGYKEAVKSASIETISKRSSYIVNSLNKLFPNVRWSVRVVNGSGEEIEVYE